MADKIQYSDLISPDVQLQLDQLTATITALVSELNKLDQATKKEEATTEDYSDTLRDQVEITEDLLKLTQDEIRLKDEIKNAKEQHEEAMKAENYEAEKSIVNIKKGEESLRKHNFVVKNATKLAIAQKGSMTELGLELAKNRMAYRELTKVERENIKVGGKLLKTIQKQDKAIKRLDSSIGNNQRNVGNYTGALSAMGGTFGMIGGRVTQVITVFTSLTAVMKGSAVATTLTSKAFKGLRIALISTGIGAIVVALGSLVAYLTDAASGTSQLAKALAPLKAIFSAVISLAKQFGEGIALMAQGKYKEGFEKITNAVANHGNEIKRHYAIQQNIAKLEEELHNQRRDSILQIQQLETEQRRLLAVAKDSEVGIQDRLAAQEEAAKIEGQIAEKRQSISALEIALLSQKSDLSEDSREDEIALQEARAAHSAIIEQQNKRMATYNAYLETLRVKSLAAAGALNILFNEMSQEDDQLILEDPYEAEAKLKREASEQMMEDDQNLMASTMERNFQDQLIAEEQLAAQERWAEFTIDMENKVANARLAAASSAIASIGAVAEAAGASAEVMKAIKIAETVINTYYSATAAYAALVGLGPAGPLLAVIGAAAAIAAGLANVATIMNTEIPTLAGGTDFLTGDSSGVDRIPIMADYGERIVPRDINRYLTGINNAELPGIVLMANHYQNGLLTIAERQLNTQQEMNKAMQRFAWVDHNGNVHFLNGNQVNYV